MQSADGRDQREMERRLVAKLKASGQLRPGYLVRALRDQRLGLFVAALAEIIGVDCTVIDRAVFPSLLAEVRRQTGGQPADKGWTATVISAATAARAFRQMMEKPPVI